MSTRLLYREEPYRVEFSARVLCCEPAGDGRFRILLDRTCFYPEGGGQPADTGTLDQAPVLDVHEQGGEVWHTTSAPLEPGRTATGRIDWVRRFSLMQHHTAEHIVSGIVHSLYKLDNVGFHMGSAMVTIDFNGELDREALEKAETLANRTVFANIPVEVSYPPEKELEAMSFRSKKALSSLEGEIRIVTVPGADRCACCGIHVARTGEIGCVKLLTPQRYKGGVRVGLLCGEAALADYREKDTQVTSVSQMLSVKQPEAADAVRRLLAQNEELRFALSDAKKQLFALRAARYAGQSRVCLLDPKLSPGELRLQAAALLEAGKPPRLALVLSGEEGSFRYALGAAGSDARALSRALHQALGGKGGGSAEFAQGAFSASAAEIEAAFASLPL